MSINGIITRLKHEVLAKREVMRNILMPAVLLSLALFLSAPFTNTAFAQTPCNQVVVDQANILSNAQENTIKREADSLSSTFGASVRIRTQNLNANDLRVALNPQTNQYELKRYFGNIQDSVCPSWQGDDYIFFYLGLSPNFRSEGMYFGTKWESLLSQARTTIQKSGIDPFFGQQKWAEGFVEGIRRTKAQIYEYQRQNNQVNSTTSAAPQRVVTTPSSTIVNQVDYSGVWFVLLAIVVVAVLGFVVYKGWFYFESTRSARTKAIATKNSFEGLNYDFDNVLDELNTEAGFAKLELTPPAAVELDSAFTVVKNSVAQAQTAFSRAGSSNLDPTRRLTKSEYVEIERAYAEAGHLHERAQRLVQEFKLNMKNPSYWENRVRDSQMRTQPRLETPRRYSGPVPGAYTHRRGREVVVERDVVVPVPVYVPVEPPPHTHRTPHGYGSENQSSGGGDSSFTNTDTHSGSTGGGDSNFGTQNTVDTSSVGGGDSNFGGTTQSDTTSSFTGGGDSSFSSSSFDSPAPSGGGDSVF